MIGMQTSNVIKLRATAFSGSRAPSPDHNPVSEYSVAALKRRNRVPSEVHMKWRTLCLTQPSKQQN